LLARDPFEPRLISWMRNPRVRRTVILMVLWGFIALTLARFNFVLLPFGLAILLAFIMAPAVDFLSGLRLGTRPIPRVAAVLGLYAVGLTFLGLFGAWAGAQVGRELAGLGGVSKAWFGHAQELTQTGLDKVEAFAVSNGIEIERQELQAYADDALANLSAEAAGQAKGLAAVFRDLVGGVVRAIFGLFLVLMLCAFLSIDAQRIEIYFRTLVPPEYLNAYRYLLEGMSVGLAGVVRGQVTICLTNGLLTFVGLWLLDVKLPLILASVATIFSLIPIFGSILSTIPIVAMALTDSVAKGLFALAWIIGIHLLEANLLNPKIMGDAAKIHPVVVVFVLIVGEQTAGLMGALFAVPIASVVLTVFKFLHKRALETQTLSEDLPRQA
jgi:predicted PurR-regulated permease PerM